ncbi:MAG: hypothetical protein II572_03290 [Clostridia bacterium]|nr:hypothetical protein [Clostridia bacterium]MBQ2567438.1 hypothetical protein [Clostridia bacterium]MBQ3995534.1 hypothetical protein [Clostridia bacterium]MBQ5480262.1 hypothetical protein [Clostridia bacterium]
MDRRFRCGWRCTAAMLVTFLLLLGMLLTGCQQVKDTSADEEAARKAKVTAASPDLTRATDKDGNYIEVSTVPDAKGDVQKGNTKKAEATATTTQKAGDMKLIIGDKTFTVRLENNETAQALKAQLPLDLEMTELNGNEKYYYYSTLPTSATRPGTIRAGDIMLFQSNTLVIFYDTFESDYSYTRIGSMTDPDGLAEALGTGDVRVEWRT